MPTTTANMQRVLSFDDTPPLSAPLRFFLSAPLFSIVAATLLLVQGPDALTSRWSPYTLALTHLMTLGFLATSMVGALIQILPIVAGVQIPRPPLTAGVVHALLTAGTALLAAAFWQSQPLLFKLAVLALAVAFAWLFLACAIGLWQAHAPEATATVTAIRLAIAALLFTVILGTALGSALGWQLALPLVLLTNLHVLWGLLGWVGLLIIGVAFQVVPMFMVTPIYPRPITRWLATTLFLLLVLWSVCEVIFQAQPHWSADMFSALIALGFVGFASSTLILLWRRKRPKADATTLFWRTAMTSLLGCAALWMMPSDAPSHSLTLGILFIVGVGYSAVNGMLYKIVPFLIWYHLQRNETGPRKQVPSIKTILPDSDAKKQFWCHLSALYLLVAATLWPTILAHAAGFSLLISSCWLALNLFNATRVYRRIHRLILADV